MPFVLAGTEVITQTMVWPGLAISLVLGSAVAVSAQTRTFTTNDIEYALELPSSNWQPVSRLDIHHHFEFVHRSDANEGYLRISKKLVKPGATAEELFRFDEVRELQHLSGYVVCGNCKGEEFAGYLIGLAFSYEYVNGGRLMAGRVYYLELNKRMFYVLHFTVAKNNLVSLRGDMEFIARSFRMKEH